MIGTREMIGGKSDDPQASADHTAFYELVFEVTQSNHRSNKQVKFKLFDVVLSRSHYTDWFVLQLNSWYVCFLESRSRL